MKDVIKANKSVIAAIALVSVIGTGIVSCTKHQGAAPDALTDKVDSTKLLDVKYGEDIKPIMTMYCVGVDGQKCHVSGSTEFAPGDFTVYQELKDRVDNGLIEAKVFSNSANMPPANSTGPTELTATDLAVFKKWVADGALEN